jgi:hypothetical protein
MTIQCTKDNTTFKVVSIIKFTRQLCVLYTLFDIAYKQTQSKQLKTNHTYIAETCWQWKNSKRSAGSGHKSKSLKHNNSNSLKKIGFILIYPHRTFFFKKTLPYFIPTQDGCHTLAYASLSLHSSNALQNIN